MKVQRSANVPELSHTVSNCLLECQLWGMLELPLEECRNDRVPDDAGISRYTQAYEILC